MKRIKITGLSFLFLLLVWAMSGTALAGWVASGGTYQYVNAKGKILSSVWHPEVNGGIVKVGTKYYCYLADGTLYKKGFLKFSDGTRYFNKSNGVMARGKIRTLNGKKYRFDERGIRYEKKWVNKQYFGKWGAMAVSKWVGRRYVGANGVYVTGLKKIGGSWYFLNPSNGYKVKSTRMKIGSKIYVFDEDGKGSPVNEPKVAVEDTWYTDPVVSDEELMTAIIYCESGNQPLAGQIAVGLVITNRMRDASFPNNLREVIYAKQQFQPARDGSLARVLRNPSLIGSVTKQAAKEVMRLYKANSYKLTLPNGKVTYLKGYYFFMTPAAYARLGLKSKYRIIKDHLFFKTWER